MGFEFFAKSSRHVGNLGVEIRFPVGCTVFCLQTQPQTQIILFFSFEKEEDFSFRLIVSRALILFGNINYSDSANKISKKF